MSATHTSGRVAAQPVPYARLGAVMLNVMRLCLLGVGASFVVALGSIAYRLTLGD